MPLIFTPVFVEDTKSDQSVSKQWKSNEKGILPFIPCFHQQVHFAVLFLRRLSSIGRSSYVGQVTGFEKSTFSLGRS